ncbi:MAG: DUF4836 family protein [Ferruginibacter sp.]
MQTKHYCKLMLIGAVAIILASCGKTNTQGKLIPKNAGIVLKMDGKSLSDKLPWDEIKQNPIFQQAYADTALPAFMKTILDNPENAGIDPKTDFMFFAIKDSIGGYVAFEGTVKDDAKFKAFNKEITKNGTESEKDNVQYISKSPVCVGWTKEKFVYIIDAPQMAQMDNLSRRMMRDSIDITSRSARDIGATCKSIFDLKEGNTLAKDDKFSALMKEKGDIHFWMNAGELNKTTASNTPLAMLNLEKLYKGNITTGTMDFDQGKITAKVRNYASEEMTKLFKKYGGGKVNEDMIKRIPGKDVVAVMALNFKPEGLQELIKLTGLDGLMNIGLSSMGFTLDDFIKANKGDVVVAVSDFSMKTDTVTYNFQDQEPNHALHQKPDFNFIFSASIGDKDAFNKLVNAGKKLGQTMGGDSSKAPIAYNSNGTFFALSNTKENVDKYLGGSTTNFDFINKINGEPYGGYINIQLLLKAFGTTAATDSSAKVGLDESLKIWDNVLWKGGNFSDGAISQVVEVNLVDKTTNSLKQLNQYAAKMALLYKEKQKKQKDEMMAYEDMVTPMTEDTTAVPSKKK